MCGVGIAQCLFNLCTTGQSNMKCQIFKLVWEPVTGVYLDNSHIMVIDRCHLIAGSGANSSRSRVFWSLSIDLWPFQKFKVHCL